MSVGLFTKDKNVAFQPIQIQPPKNLSTIHIFQQFRFHSSPTQAGYSKALSWFMPLPVLPVKHVIFSSCDLYKNLLQIFYQIHIIDHDFNRFIVVQCMFGWSSWVCFIFLVNYVVVTNQSNLQFDWFCLLVLCEPIILKTPDGFSLLNILPILRNCPTISLFVHIVGSLFVPHQFLRNYFSGSGRVCLN